VNKIECLARFPVNVDLVVVLGDSDLLDLEIKNTSTICVPGMDRER
jgi:hypothetical protein